jgi:hypothetical protein
MRSRLGAAIVTVAAVAAVTLVVVLSDGSSTRPASREAGAGADPATPASSPAARFRGAREDCSTRSEASFPGAFTSPRNLVVGPLVFIGGAYTDASTVREFGGNKFPLLVKAGHTVTVRLARRRKVAGLAYGPLPQGETKLRDTYQSVTFVACRPGRASPRYSPNGPSGSYADGAAVTFWSGFVLTRAPACIPLDIYVDDAPSPRRVGLSLGRRCVPSLAPGRR